MPVRRLTEREILVGIAPKQLPRARATIRRLRKAERVAKENNVDPGDVEHVLFNLTLTPIERLRRSIQRVNLRGIANKR